MEVVLTLDSKDMQECSGHAEAVVAHFNRSFGARGSGQYNHNRLSSNLVGVKCEVGTHRWLERNGLAVEPVYKQIENQSCDIRAGANLIEVKGLRPAQWEKFKRMVPPSQLSRYIKKSALIVWALAEGDSADPTVTIKGWNHAKDFLEKQAVKEVQTVCPNVWLWDDRHMRTPDTLLQHLLSIPLPSLSTEE